MKVFKIICEGNTDFEVMQPVAEEVGRLNGDKYKAKILFPPKKDSDAGWSNLKTWCMDQASILEGTQNAQLQLAAKLLGAKPVAKVKSRKTDLITAATLIAEDGASPKIIIQIDSDIAHDLLRDIGVDKNDVSIFPLHPTERIRVCELALDSWLGGHKAKKGETIFYCITGFALENWILTLHDPVEFGVDEGFDYDLISDPELKLIQLNYPSKIRNGVRRLKKDPPKYRIHGDNISRVLASCVARSSSLRKYKETLSGA